MSASNNAEIIARKADRVHQLEQALKQIAELEYVTEETAWTWKDVAQEQKQIAESALETSPDRVH